MYENFLFAEYMSAQTFKYIIGFILFVLLAIYFYMAVKYILQNNVEQGKTARPLNKQEYVKQNLHIFGIKDCEGSEIKEVYVVPFEKMGLVNKKDILKDNSDELIEF